MKEQIGIKEAAELLGTVTDAVTDTGLNAARTIMRWFGVEAVDAPGAVSFGKAPKLYDKAQVEQIAALRSVLRGGV